MVNLNEQIMLNIAAKDNASNVAKNIDSSFQGMASNLSKAMSSISSSMMNFSAISDNALQGLTGKSALDNIIGTKSKAETNNVLLKNMLDDQEKNFDNFYKKVDETTDSSLTSMQELIPALKAFKSATGATDAEMTNITEDMANFGAAVLAQTGSTDLAQGAMMDLSKGVKGAFAALDQYGITQASLERTGYWNGDEKDVEGFMKAVTKVTGSTEELMETNTGLDALIGKAFSRAGKKLGTEFLPVLKYIKKGFLELDEETGGALAGSILAASGAMEVMNQGFWNISTAVNGVNDLKTAFSSLKDIVKSTGKAAEATSDALNMGSNISQIGADVSGASKTMGGAGNFALDMGLGGLGLADSIKDTSKQEKEAKKLYEERGKLLEKIHNFDKSKDSKEFKKLQKELSKNDVKLKKGIDGYNPIDLLRGNKNKKELSSKELSSLFSFNENTIKGIQKENYGLTNALKDFKTNKIEGAAELLDSSGEKFQKSIINFSKKPRDAGISLKNSFTSFSESLSNIKGDGLKGNFKKIDKKLYQSLKGTSSTVETLGSLGDIGEGAGDAMKALKGVEEIEEATETVVGGASAIGALGPEAAAASAEVGATATATTTLSGAFTSMIVPLLAISAVIIIMLPIVAVIAAEAMVLLKLLGEFMDSLDFGSIDLSSSIKGLKSIAEGLAWVGVAMAAMSFASVMTGLAFITGGFLGMTTPLEIAKDALMDAANILKEFSTVTIDSSVPTNLKNIGESLSSVSTAMMALTSTNITTGFSDFVAWAFGFGSVTDALGKAKEDLVKASSAINELATGITPLNEEDANKIQNVCDSLASVGDAIGALRSIRDGQNWDSLLGGFAEGIFGSSVDIGQALNDVKSDIAAAARSLQGFKGLPKIPEDVGTKLKSISDALTSVSEAFQSLRKLRDDNNWDGFVGGIFPGVNIADAITNVGNDIRMVSVRLASLSTIANVDSSVSEKITNINTALGKVSEAVKSMQNLPSMEGFSSESISTAITNVRNAATQLATLKNITLGEDDTSILGTIQTAMESLKTALSSASGFSAPSTSIGSQIVNGVKSGLSPLAPSVQGAVTSATSTAASNGWTGGAYIGTSTTNGMKSALKLKETMSTEISYTLNAITSKRQEFYNAGVDLGKAVKEGFESQPAINPGSPGNLAHTMMDEVAYIKEAMTSKYGEMKATGARLGNSILTGFGNPTFGLGLNSSLNDFTSSQMGALQTIVSQAPANGAYSNVTIIFGEGAVNVDARNKTEREAQQIMITALESLDSITDIKVTGA